ncbi:serine-threonine protein kinase, putative [Entamoeba invadens IP1]|uniref:serine-threonine protein kinase, putative n=1 Tax=Entamoeba invadens IP1 TaxID=370355 RepID=UPI0002C3F1DA|nr:serine-threonine protein kinase, putative [Entamoeba invadens IP1]ELP94062.1 serine-threonine protein kinase, putative [Entamoeba invadens IP1]|eukprot:XP_004260833.1 serine-threonine protein kinase, putative [Entamoeba invadens IP1]
MAFVSFLFSFFLCVNSTNENGCYCIDYGVNTCDICNNGCYLNLVDCQKCPINCTFCTSKTTCTQCKSGMFWNGTACMPCDFECKECSSYSVCTSCKFGYYLENTQCYSCREGCEQCDNSTHCTTCDSLQDLVLHDGMCVYCSSVIPRCVSCKGKKCILCEMGYFASENGECIQCDRLCGKSGCDINGCIDCANNFILSIDNRCTLPVEAHCIEYDRSWCTSCATSYHLIDGKCFPDVSCDSSTSIRYDNGCVSQKVSNCQIIDLRNQVCQVCKPGYSLHSTICVENHSQIPHCVRLKFFIDSYICSVCEYPYYPFNEKCLPVDNLFGCVEPFNVMNVYEGSTSRCMKCIEGIQSVNYHCFFSPYCISYKSDRCVLCIDDFLLVDGVCVSCKAIHCISSKNDKCTLCEDGYHLNENFLCNYNDMKPHCEQYKDNLDCCVMCKDTYLLSNCSCINCTIKHCKRCSTTNNSCDVCYPSYYSKEDGCVECSIFGEGCDICNESGCLSCKSGMYLSTHNNVTFCSNCSENSAFCVSCTYEGSCQVCDKGTVLVNKTCLLCNETIPSCQTCQGGFCTLCEIGFYRDNTKCDSCELIDHCEMCANEGLVCTKCQSDHILNVETNVCERCVDYFDNCVECDENNTSCVLCENNQIPFDNKCDSASSSTPNCSRSVGDFCVLCVHGFVLRNGTCYKYHKSHCMRYSSFFDYGCYECDTSIPFNGICANYTRNETCYFYLENNNSNFECLFPTNILVTLQCAPNQYLTQTNPPFCEFCSLNCALCVDKETCLKCEYGYLINNGKCEPQQNCNVTDVSYCSQCNDGYYWNGSTSKCSPCLIQHCKTCDTSSSCLLCFSDYLNTSLLCEFQQMLHCALQINGFCISCEAGYFLENLVCVRNTIENCLLQFRSTLCLLCNNNTNLVSSYIGDTTCSKEKNIHCLLESPSGCLRCEDGYFLLSTWCFPCQHNCDKCSQQKIGCDKCSFGFLWNSTTQSCTTVAYFQESCKYFAKNRVGCAICHSGYFLQDFQCEKCDDSCRTCNDSSVYCSDCNENGGYFRAEDNSCQSVATILHCNSTKQNYCEVCDSGYYNYGIRCQPCQIGCELCTNKDECIGCMELYVMRETKECVLYSDINRCIGYNDKKCSQCMDMYVPNAVGDVCVYSWQFIAMVGTPSLTFAVIIIAIILVIVFVFVCCHKKTNDYEEFITRDIVFSVKKAKIPFTKLLSSKMETNKKCLDYLNEARKPLLVNERAKNEVYLANMKNTTVQIKFLGMNNANFDIQVEPQCVVLKKMHAVKMKVSIKPNCTYFFRGQLKFSRLDMKKGKYSEFNIPLLFKTETTNRISADEIQVSECIGTSIFGKTFKVNYRGETAVLKKVNYIKEETLEEFQRVVIEADKCGRGKFVASFIGAIFQTHKMGILLEYNANGSLSDILKKTKPTKDVLIRLGYDIIRGIFYLHYKGIIHYDIKPQNVLIYSLNKMSDICAKITDCGIKKCFKLINFNTLPFKNNIGIQYIAPEMFYKRTCTPAVDMFAFGVLVFEMFCGNISKMFKSSWEITKFFCEGKRLKKTEEIEQWIYDLVQDCWKQSPEERTNARNVVLRFQRNAD